jgi:hypothetical protein
MLAPVFAAGRPYLYAAQGGYSARGVLYYILGEFGAALPRFALSIPIELELSGDADVWTDLSNGHTCLWALGPNNPPSLTTPRSLVCAVNTSGHLVLRSTGATAADYRERVYANFRADYLGKALRLLVVFAQPGATTAPKVYIDGADADGLFGAETTAGTPPAWLDADLQCIYHHVLTPAPRGVRYIPGGLHLGAWSAAEALSWARTGTPPAWTQHPAASSLPTYTHANGSTNADADGPGIPPSSGWHRHNFSRSFNAGEVSDNNALAPNLFGEQWVWIFGEAFVPTTSPITHLVLKDNNGLTHAACAITPGQVSPFRLALRLPPRASQERLHLYGNTSASGTIASLPNPTYLYTRNTSCYFGGDMLQPVVQPGSLVVSSRARARLGGCLDAVVALGPVRSLLFEIPLGRLTADQYLFGGAHCTIHGQRFVAATLHVVEGASAPGTLYIRAGGPSGTVLFQASGLGAANTFRTILPADPNASGMHTLWRQTLHVSCDAWNGAVVSGVITCQRFL